MSDESMFRFCDDLGPAQVLHLYDRETGLKGIVVVDNVACGPSIGGVRMAADVSFEEVFRLARAMTLKNAAAGLPHGGGKSGILADSKGDKKRDLIRAFGRLISDVEDYVPGPDMGTDETCMAWLRDAAGRAVGLPRVLGGIPLDEIGATAHGLVECAEVAAPAAGIEIDGARVVVEGFGNVGRHAARFLEDRGAKLVGASDSTGAIYDSSGIEVAALIAAKRETGSVANYSKQLAVSKDDLLMTNCDILIPAARPDSIHAGNAEQIKAKLILQGANIPATADAEKILHTRGVVNVPDFIANAGGVICAAVEYAGGTEADALTVISDKVRRNTAEVLERANRGSSMLRQAAIELATERVKAAMALRAR